LPREKERTGRKGLEGKGCGGEEKERKGKMSRKSGLGMKREEWWRRKRRGKEAEWGKGKGISRIRV